MEFPANAEIHPKAFRESQLAHHWYAQRSARAAEKFVEALQAAAIKIVEHPDWWTPYSKRTRFVKLRRFPYLVIYETTAGDVHIVAIAHARRRPHYWRRRLK